MIQRKTQTGEYWRAFSLTEQDIEFLRNLLLEVERPLTTQVLARALLVERCRREESELRAELALGTMYQPKRTLALGEKVIFPALDFRLGEVVSIRAGENPEYGEFDVVTVDFGPDRRRRSFAARLSAPHKLNLAAPELAISEDIATPEEMLATVASGVPGALERQLETRPDFARFEDSWLPRELVSDVHVGHLNIAEALIDMRSAPVDASLLVKELDMPAELKPEIALFSVQSALAADGRFDEVGQGESRRWYLCRLEPVEALQVPAPLMHEATPYRREGLPPSLQQLEWELDDEWTDVTHAQATSPYAAVPSTTLLLIYPHLVSGTLPLNRRSRAFFPTAHGARAMVTLIDGRWGQRFPAWVVREGRYVAGLRSWFEQHKLVAGAYIVLERREESEEIVVDFRPKRMRREWTRWAHAVDARLDIQLRKQEVACEYDEFVIIGEDQPAEIAKLRAEPAYAVSPLAELVHEVFVDVAGLSQQGSVHAKTIYSALNVIRRCPPGPIFEILATDPHYQATGDDFYHLAI